MDDLLDFVGSSQQLGKPASGADLKLGLATAPVLFASVKFPELEPLIQRRFSNQGDVEAAFKVIFAMGWGIFLKVLSTQFIVQIVHSSFEYTFEIDIFFEKRSISKSEVPIGYTNQPRSSGSLYAARPLYQGAGYSNLVAAITRGWI